MKYYLLAIFLTCTLGAVQAQFTEAESVTQRVLFVLDGSGSMKKQWGEQTKFEVAKEMLYALADSMAENDPNIELGIRIFGHQSPRTDYNCEDSKLEVKFSKDYQIEFREVLSQIEPQGHTPIAYSLMESAKDFPIDSSAINSIILITDGLENCEGNPCEASAWLQEKRITINPFIIGLDISENEAEQFDCIGTFLNAKDASTFEKILTTTVQSATAATTIEINLLSARGSMITNTPFSLIDAFSGHYLGNYIHAITKSGNSDTMYVDPRGTYNIKVHTLPNLYVEGVKLIAGEHNVINIPIRKGFLNFEHEELYDEHAAHYVVRMKNDDDILFTYALKNEQFLVGSYSLAIDFRPMLEEKEEIPLERRLQKELPTNGTLSIELNEGILASVYQDKDGEISLVYDMGSLTNNYQLKLQPGDYILVHISKSSRKSKETMKSYFTISEGKKTVVQLK